MTWTKLDDGLPRNPKIVGLTDAAFRLYICALCYASEQLTDGEVPAAAIPGLARRNASKLIKSLIEVGLIHDESSTCSSCPPMPKNRYYLHGFLDYNPSAEEVEEQQHRRSDKARRAARARWDSSRNRANGHAPSIAPGMLGEQSKHMLHDAPSRPVLSNSSLDSLTRTNPQAVDNCPRCQGRGNYWNAGAGRTIDCECTRQEHTA